MNGALMPRSFQHLPYLDGQGRWLTLLVDNRVCCTACCGQDLVGTAMYFEIISPVVCAFAGAAWTLGMFFVSLWRHFANQVMEGDRPASVGTWLKDDRFWAGWLCACAIFMLYYFY